MGYGRIKFLGYRPQVIDFFHHQHYGVTQILISLNMGRHSNFMDHFGYLYFQVFRGYRRHGNSSHGGYVFSSGSDIPYHLFYPITQNLKIKWLQDVIIRSQLHRFLGNVLLAEGGKNYDFRTSLKVKFVDLLQNPYAIHIGHNKVENEYFNLLFLQYVQNFHTIGTNINHFKISFVGKVVP